MKILVCNVGSTSLKYRLFDMDAQGKTMAEGAMERVGAAMGSYRFSCPGKPEQAGEAAIPDYGTGISMMLDVLVPAVLPSLNEISCVAFKVVHGGPLTGVQALNEETLARMARYNTVAPSHNPPYIAAIRMFAALLPGVPLIGSFETGFHRNMPPKAYLYSLPKELYTRYGVRRYGFHGASHEYVSGRVRELTGGGARRVVTCHLGGSGSLCAVLDGVSVDTNLGFSLQCGVMHNNRCGDIDPYILIYLMKEQGYTLDRIERMLNKESGLLGMSGVSNDLRDVMQAAEQGNTDAKNAVDSYCYAVKKQIGAYAAALDGLDAIAFAGGIGERSAFVRRESLSGLDWMGVRLDEEKNLAAKPDCEISDGTGKVRIFVIQTNEEWVVAKKAAAYLSGATDVPEGL